MMVLKKINNNVAVCQDGNGRELIAFGKGIGFPPTPYELTDLKKVDRTFYNVSSKYIPLLNDFPVEIVQFTARQILEIQDKLPYETSANLVLTLADHIAFAIERAGRGIYVQMPSVYERRSFFVFQAAARGRSEIDQLQTNFMEGLVWITQQPQKSFSSRSAGRATSSASTTV